MTARALLPCPFCGGEPALSYVGNDRTKSRKLTVKCSGCRVQLTHAAIRHGFAWLEDHITSDWNRRIASSLAEQPAKVEGALNPLDEHWLRCAIDEGTHPATQQPSDPADADEVAEVIADLRTLGKEEGWICASAGADLLEQACATPPTAQRHEAKTIAEAEVSGIWGWRVWIGNKCVKTMLSERDAHDLARNINVALAANGAGAAVEAVALGYVSAEVLDGIRLNAELGHAWYGELWAVRDDVNCIPVYTSPPQQRSEQVAGGGGVDDALVAKVEKELSARYFDHDDYKVTTDLLHDFAVGACEVFAALSTQPLCTCPVSVEYPARFHSPTCALRAALHPEQAKDGAAG